MFEHLRPGDCVQVCFSKQESSRFETAMVEQVGRGQIWVAGFRYPFATVNGLYMWAERLDERVHLEQLEKLISDKESAAL